MDWFFTISPWLALSASLVGFVMGFKELREFKEDIKDKEGWEKRKVVLALLGWWLMAISGLWGGIADFMESEKTDREMEALVQVVSNAKGEAEKANEGQAKANAEAARANERAAALEKEATEARLEQQKLATALRETKNKAEAAHTIASQTEEKQRPRTIPAERRAELVAFLKNAPHGNVTLGATESDLEAMALMRSISSVLREAGNNVTEAPWIMASGPNGAPVGLLLMIKSKDNAPEFATIILNALHAVGLPVKGVDNPSVEEGTLKIQVGAKPQ